MSPEGEDRPPKRPDKPEYKVYGSPGRRRKRRAAPSKSKQPPQEKPPAEPKQAAQAEQAAADKQEAKPDQPAEAKQAGAKQAEAPEQAAGSGQTEAKPEAGAPAKRAGDGDRPQYTLYRSRPSLRDRLGKPDIGSLGGGGLRERLPSFGGGGRRWLIVIVAAIGAWILISFISFAISAQVQKEELSDEAKEALAGGPDVLAGQNILIIGGDQRGQQVGSEEPGAQRDPPRADSIMVLHAGLTSFRKLSIPRDTLAEIPGFGAEKINSAFSATGFRNGDAALMIRTVEQFLGIDINHLIIVDFDGFVDFIDTLGGVTVDLKKRVCGEVSGGKENGGVTIELKPGEHTLESQKALALARLRINDCDPSEDDRDRAERQQLVLSGIKGRLTSITRAPINFVKGPWIGWAAPKAFISDMGGFTLPQVAIAAFFGGGGNTNVLKPSQVSPAGNLIISQGTCERAVEELTGGPPDETPRCSPPP
jgi:LCP family protein required for cell wall assembly